MFWGRKSKKLTVEEAREQLLKKISDRLGWKLVKSQRAIKKRVGDLTFVISFVSNKYNESYKNIEVVCVCYAWCKEFDKEANVNSTVINFDIHQKGRWIDISTEKKLTDAINTICNEVEQSILPLSVEFEKDFKKAVLLLAQEEYFEKYRVDLKFIDRYAGREFVLPLAKKIYNSLDDMYKEDMIRYKYGATGKWWMSSHNNIKYIVDNELVDLEKRRNNEKDGYKSREL